MSLLPDTMQLLDAECRHCGCSHYDPCEGGCVWAEPDLCSRCARELPTDPTLGELGPFESDDDGDDDGDDLEEIR